MSEPSSESWVVLMIPPSGMGIALAGGSRPTPRTRWGGGWLAPMALVTQTTLTRPAFPREADHDPVPSSGNRPAPNGTGIR
ncbi:hypothetical protein GCM10023166_01040 [Paeniglutamicibacter cryotolerans]